MPPYESASSGIEARRPQERMADLHDAGADVEDGDVEGAAAEVENHNALVLRLCIQLFRPQVGEGYFPACRTTCSLNLFVLFK